MSFTIESARSVFPDVADAVPATVESFNQLNAEDQLALFWFAYPRWELQSLPASRKG